MAAPRADTNERSPDDGRTSRGLLVIVACGFVQAAMIWLTISPRMTIDAPPPANPVATRVGTFKVLIQ